MTDAPNPETTGDEDDMLNHADALAAIARAAFARAKKAAIEENDRHGVPSYGSENGRIVVRQPAAKASAEPA